MKIQLIYLITLLALSAVTLAYPPESNFEVDVPTSNIDKPDFLATFIDPEFNTQVKRITERSNQSRYVHPYPKQQAWNQDQSLLKLGYRIYDAKTFEETSITKGLSNNEAYFKLGSPGFEIRWSNVDSKVLYALDTNFQFKKITIDENETSAKILHDFSGKGYTELYIGQNEGNIDYNDRYVVLVGRKQHTDEVFPILYNIQSDVVVWGNDNKVLPRGRWKKNGDPKYFDWVTVSPYGNHILLSAEGYIYQYDIELKNERKLGIGNHGDIGIHQNGQQFYVQFEFDSGGVEIENRRGIWGYNLETKEAIKLISDKYNGGHVSCRNYLRPGWCYINTSAEGHKEVFSLKLDNGSGTVQRYAQTHVSVKNRGLSQVGVSPDGNALLFASDWGREDNVVDTYHVSKAQSVDITTWKASYLAGDDVWIELKDKPENHDDWIGIYPSGSSNDWSNQVAWSWARDPSPAQDDGEWYKFEGLLPGKYEARFFLNNSYVTEDAIAFEIIGSSDFAITSWKAEYEFGDDIWIELDGKREGTDDWIGIYPSGSSNDWSNQVAWGWAREPSPSQDAGDWYQFTDVASGNYEARFFLDNSYVTKDKVTFTIKGHAP